METSSDTEYYCETHNKYFKDERGLQVHLTKMHSDKAIVEEEHENNEDIDLDSLLSKIKISGFLNLIFAFLAKKYKDDRIRLTDEESAIIDGAFADALSALPKAVISKVRKWLPVLPILLVFVPLILKKFSFVIEDADKRSADKRSSDKQDVQEEVQTNADTA